MKIEHSCCAEGGAIVLSPDRNIIENIGKMYAGRASASPCIDLFITLLSMGMDGYKSILTNRLRLLPKFKQLLSGVASNYGERLLDCPSNTISFAVTLSSTPICRSFPSRGTDDCDQVPEIDPNVEKNEASQLSYLGSMLFSRCVSGARVVPRRQNKTIGKHHFLGYGSSTDSYEESYFTAACAIGLTEAEIEEFASRLDKALKIFLAKRKK